MDAPTTCICQNWTTEQWASMDTIREHLESISVLEIIYHDLYLGYYRLYGHFCINNYQIPLNVWLFKYNIKINYKNINSNSIPYYLVKSLKIIESKHKNALLQLYQRDVIKSNFIKYLPLDLVKLIIKFL